MVYLSIKNGQEEVICCRSVVMAPVRHTAFEEMVAAACPCIRADITRPMVSMSLTVTWLATLFLNPYASGFHPTRVDMGFWTSRELASLVMNSSYLLNFEALTAFKIFNELRRRALRYDRVGGLTNVTPKKSVPLVRTVAQVSGLVRCVPCERRSITGCRVAFANYDVSSLTCQ